MSSGCALVGAARIGEGLDVGEEPELWAWDSRREPGVYAAFDVSGDLDWCDSLEDAPEDAVDGKVACTVAALGVVESVLEKTGELNRADVQMARATLRTWIGTGSDDAADQVFALAFSGDEEEPPTPRGRELPEVLSWALRCATSSVGNYEAGWALRGCAQRALDLGLTPQALKEAARRELACWDDAEKAARGKLT